MNSGMIQIKYQARLNNFQLAVDICIPSSGITVIFGESGSGKSSLLNLIAGFDNAIRIEAAQLSLNNTVYDHHENKIRLKPWKRNIAYVFQDNRLFPHMTVEQNILFGFSRRNHESSALNKNDLIKKFKITDLLQQYPSQLSGGQKQRVSMVRALLSSPDLLIMDEPLAALDYASRQELLPYIESIHNELTIPVIYVSHDIKEVLRLADYIVLMNKGGVVAQGELSELCVSQPLLTQAEGSSFILQGDVDVAYTDEKLLSVNCENETILITGEGFKAGDALRILIHAKDVSLCITPPTDSSILNCVSVVIDSIVDNAHGKFQVYAKLGEQIVVAMISQRSCKALNLKAGKQVYAQFKATAMLK